MKPQFWGSVASYVGRTIDQCQIERLEQYRSWIAAEAIPAGAVGPSERNRLETRHIADSLLFARFLRDGGTIWDLGSGVGLPGIPLAVVMPANQFVMIDRSRRRVDLMRRAIRVLGLENAEVWERDVNQLSGLPDAIVSRATLAPDAILDIARSILSPGGIAVAGGSWTAAPRHSGWDTVEVPAEVLDRPVWILIMQQQ